VYIIKYFSEKILWDCSGVSHYWKEKKKVFFFSRHTEHVLNICKKLVEHALDTRWNLIWYMRYVFGVCSTHVQCMVHTSQCMLNVCSTVAQRICITCSTHVQRMVHTSQCMLNVSSTLAQRIWITCSTHVQRMVHTSQRMLNVSSTLAQRICITCSTHAQCMFNACSTHMHNMLNACATHGSHFSMHAEYRFYTCSTHMQCIQIVVLPMLCVLNAYSSEGINACVVNTQIWPEDNEALIFIIIYIFNRLPFYVIFCTS
jgi:hypothetical protein